MELQLETIIVICIIFIAIIVILKKNIESRNTPPIKRNVPKIQSILKKHNNTKTEPKFYDVRMAKNSNDILFNKNIKPTTELLNMYPPILENIPTNNDVFQGRKENKELRWNI